MILAAPSSRSVFEGNEGVFLCVSTNRIAVMLTRWRTYAKVYGL